MKRLAIILTIFFVVFASFHSVYAKSSALTIKDVDTLTKADGGKLYKGLFSTSGSRTMLFSKTTQAAYYALYNFNPRYDSKYRVLPSILSATFLFNKNKLLVGEIRYYTTNNDETVGQDLANANNKLKSDKPEILEPWMYSDNAYSEQSSFGIIVKTTSGLVKEYIVKGNKKKWKDARILAKATGEAKNYSYSKPTRRIVPFMVDGEYLSGDYSAPFLEVTKNIVYVPVLTILDHIPGLKYSMDKKAGTIETRNTELSWENVSFQTNFPIVTLNTKNMNALVNNKPFALDPAPFTLNGTIYLPLNTVESLYGIPLRWDAKKLIVSMDTSKLREQYDQLAKVRKEQLEAEKIVKEKEEQAAREQLTQLMKQEQQKASPYAQELLILIEQYNTDYNVGGRGSDKRASLDADLQAKFVPLLIDLQQRVDKEQFQYSGALVAEAIKLLIDSTQTYAEFSNMESVTNMIRAKGMGQKAMEPIDEETSLWY